MVFLAPGWLLLSLLALPILLLHARRQKVVTVGSLRLWKAVRPAASPRPHWRWPPPSLLLFLQIATVIALALALSQPRLAADDLPDHTIFVIDSSATMRARDVAPDRLTAARALIEAELPAALSTGLASIVAVSADPAILAARQSRLAAIAPRLEALSPSDAAPDWPAAARRIQALIEPSETTRIRVLTDKPDPLDLPDLDLVPTIIGTPDIANAALTATATPIEGTPGRWLLAGAVTASDPAYTPAELSVRFARTGLEGELDWARIPLGWEEGADGLPTASFATALDFPGPGRLTLALPDDPAPADNAVYLTLDPAPPLGAVLIVGPEHPGLIRALEAAGAADISRADSLPANDGDFDLVVVNGLSLPRDPATNTLWLGPADTAPLATHAFSAWDESHPLSEGIQWWRLPPQPVLSAAPMPGGTIIAEAGGVPLLEARTTRNGHQIRLAADLDTAPLADGPILPLLIANLSDWIGGDATCRAGTPCALPARFLDATITGPDGFTQTLGISDETGFAARPFIPARAGFYRLEQDGRSLDIAVNPAIQPAAIGATPTEAQIPPAAIDLRPILAALAILLLIAEAIVAGRGAEKFLIPSQLRSGAPHATRRRWALGLRLSSLGLVAMALLAVPFPAREPANALVALLDPSPASDTDLSAFAAQGEASIGAIDTASTGFSDALHLAAAMLPADRDGHIRLASPGQGSLAALASPSVPVDVLPLPAMPAGEVVVGSVSVPAQAAPGQTIPGNGEIFSQSGGPARVSLLQNGLPVRSEDIELTAGNNSFPFELPARATGPLLVEIMVQADRDHFGENNRNGALIEVAEPDPILIISPDTGDAQAFAQALSIQGIPATVSTPNAAPRTLRDWLGYPLVALLNTPARALTTAQQEQLATAVEQHGRGLLMLGGENAFGAGGYYETPLEDLSPLSSRVPHEAPQAALIFVLDRSGSMAGAVGPVTRLDIAKGAVTRAMDLMTPDSLIGVVAFDETAQTPLPLTPRGEEGALGAAIAGIVPGGGTRLSPALLSAVDQLAPVEASVKHVIVVTDGLIEPLDFSHILDRARAADITVSTVAVGTSAITDRLETIANLGGGTYYATREFGALPSILSQDIMTLGDPLVREESAAVRLAGERPEFLAQLPDTIPPLTSHVRTSLKPEADLHLALDDGDEEIPIMASWRYGSGRVLAFAAHGAGSGTRDWMELSGFPLLWAQTVRHFLPDVLGPGLHVRLERAGDQVGITADLIGLDGAPIPAQPVTAALEDAPAITLAETTPGRYRGRLDLPHVGEYAITVTAGEISQTATIHIPYPARYDFTRADPDALARLARLTGGRVLSDPSERYTPQFRWSLAPAPWVWLLLALAAFLADLIVRKGWLRLPISGRARH